MRKIIKEIQELYKIINPTEDQYLRILELNKELQKAIELNKGKPYTIEEIIDLINEAGFFGFIEYVPLDKLDKPFDDLIINCRKTLEAIKAHLTTIDPNWKNKIYT